MQLARLMMAIAGICLLTSVLQAEEPEALEQFARWRTAMSQIDRLELTFRLVHLDYFGGLPLATKRTMSGVCYRDADLWAMKIVPAPISALEPQNGSREQYHTHVAFNPEVVVEAFTVIDGPESLYYAIGNEEFQVSWKPASAMNPANQRMKSWHDMPFLEDWWFSPINFIPLFWPREIDVSKYDMKQTVNPSSGDVSLILQRRPTTFWSPDRSYRTRHIEFDHLVAVFRPESHMPYAVAFRQSSGMFQIRFFAERYATAELADIPSDAFQSLVQTRTP